MRNSGVRLPTASAIVAFLEPESYSVIDYRACQFLCNVCKVEINNRPLNQQNLNHWERFQLECRKLLEKVKETLARKATLRDLDRAMWMYHKRHPEQFQVVGFDFEDIFRRFAHFYIEQIKAGLTPDIPFSEKERDLFCKGVKDGLIEELGHRFNFTGSDKGPYNLFAINREYITHAAAYVELIMKYGYQPSQCKIVYRNMDIALFIEGRLFAYHEAKASDKNTEKLIEGIMKISGDLKRTVQHERDDAFRKAEIIMQNRPRYFIVYTPQVMRTFEVIWTERGFSLQETDLPIVSAKSPVQ